MSTQIGDYYSMMRRNYRQNVCYRLSACCFDRFLNINFTQNFCLTCFCILVFIILFFCIGIYLYLFETASLEIGNEYFFYFCLLLSFEVLLIVSGCILCVFADHGDTQRKKYQDYNRNNARNNNNNNVHNNNNNNKNNWNNKYMEKSILLHTPGNDEEKVNLLANDDGSDSELEDFITDDGTDDEDWKSAVGDDDFDPNDDINYSIYMHNNDNINSGSSSIQV